MNIALFKQANPSLQTVVDEWFARNPGILDRHEEVEIGITPRMRSTRARIVLGGVLAGDLNDILSKSFNILRQFLPENSATRILNALDNANKLTIRDVVAMTELEFVKYRHVSRISLLFLKEALQKLDHRLSLGMPSFQLPPG